ncbi:MAG TPA: hypothetical protein VFN22_00785 [Gemmatimonadales bacterium]|nr:hypothetical protein [Gemmatimonadales bacterium]
MADFRKVRAGLRLAMVSAMFWGVAALLGRIGFSIVQGHPVAAWLSIPWLLTRFFLPGALVGFVGGGIYAAAIALAPRQNHDAGLSGMRAALFGAIGGIVVFLAIRFTLLADGTLGLMATLIPTAVFGVLGAATGLGILGTAKRASLRSGDAPPKRVAP